MSTTHAEQLIKSAQHALQLQSNSRVGAVPITSDREIELLKVDMAKESDLETLKKKQELDQQDKRFAAEMEQRRMDRELKKNIATLVFRFLAVETLALFIVVLIQGFAPLGFKLDDSTINIFLGATLLQISSMAVIITRHLYPTGE